MGYESGIGYARNINSITTDVIGTSPLGNLVAFASTSGNDSTGQIGQINRPYLTIQAAYDAVKVNASINNPATVILLDGQYIEDVTFDTDFVSVTSLHGMPQMYNAATIAISTENIFGSIRPVDIQGTMTVTATVGCNFYGFNVSNIAIEPSTGSTLANFYHNIACIGSVTGVAGDTINDRFTDVHTFGTFLDLDAIFIGYINKCMFSGDCLLSGATSVFSGTAEDIVTGDLCFCTDGGTMSGTVKRHRIIGGSYSYGATNTTDAGTVSGLIDGLTIAGHTQSLASQNGAGAAGTFSGTGRNIISSGLSGGAGKGATLTSTGLIEYSNIVAGGKFGTTCFNRGAIEGTVRNSTGGVDSWGGNGGSIASTALFDNVRTTDPDGFADGTAMTGTMRNSSIKATTTDKEAMTGGDGGRVYNCTLVSNGTANSIEQSGAINMKIAHCRLNNGIDANITNDIGTPYNVDDTDVDV